MIENIVRAFGRTRQALDIDFVNTPRPDLVTRILECCMDTSGEEGSRESSLWELTVGDRIANLLRILSVGGTSHLELRIQCNEQDCGEDLEIAVPIGELIEIQSATRDVETVTARVNGDVLSLRKPTGSDQREWLKKSFGDDKDVVLELMRSLLIDPESSPQKVSVLGEAIQQIDSAMQEADPLLNFRLTIRCPSCAVQQAISADLQERALAHLRRVQQSLLEEIHFLAFHYHWNEAQILEIPPQRRGNYIDMLDREGVF